MEQKLTCHLPHSVISLYYYNFFSFIFKFCNTRKALNNKSSNLLNKVKSLEDVDISSTSKSDDIVMQVVL